MHAQKFGEVDLMVHGLYRKLDSWNKDTYEDRYRMGFTSSYRLNDSWLLSLSSVFNKLDNSSFFIWNFKCKLIFSACRVINSCCFMSVFIVFRPVTLRSTTTLPLFTSARNILRNILILPRAPSSLSFFLVTSFLGKFLHHTPFKLTFFIAHLLTSPPG